MINGKRVNEGSDCAICGGPAGVLYYNKETDKTFHSETCDNPKCFSKNVINNLKKQNLTIFKIKKKVINTKTDDSCEVCDKKANVERTTKKNNTTYYRVTCGDSKCVSEVARRRKQGCSRISTYNRGYVK